MELRSSLQICTMSDENDEANVFAIPDFWKSSKWFDVPATGPHAGGNVDFFNLNLRGM